MYKYSYALVSIHTFSIIMQTRLRQRLSGSHIRPLGVYFRAVVGAGFTSVRRLFLGLQPLPVQLPRLDHSSLRPGLDSPQCVSRPRIRISLEFTLADRWY